MKNENINGHRLFEYLFFRDISRSHVPVIPLFEAAVGYDFKVDIKSSRHEIQNDIGELYYNKNENNISLSIPCQLDHYERRYLSACLLGLLLLNLQKSNESQLNLSFPLHQLNHENEITKFADQCLSPETLVKSAWISASEQSSSTRESDEIAINLLQIPSYVFNRRMDEIYKPRGSETEINDKLLNDTSDRSRWI